MNPKFTLNFTFFLCFLAFTVHIAAQELAWKRNFSGTGNNRPYKSSIDHSNNQYIAGQFSGTCDATIPILTTKGGNDIFIVKYDANGSLKWAKQLGSNLSDLPTGIIVTSDDQFVYLTGTFQGTLYADSLPSLVSSGADDGFLAKYNNNGDLIWIKHIAYGLGANMQRPGSIKIDKNNQIIIGGTFISNITLGNENSNIAFSTTSSVGMFISQFDLDGNLLNAKKFEASSSPSQLNSLDCDNSGYYLSGFFPEIFSQTCLQKHLMELLTCLYIK
jgi:hypothetical protein